MDSILGGHILIPAVALLIGYLLLPALNIYRVNARGLGDEHGQPWRAKAKAVSVFLAVMAGLSQMRRKLDRVMRHPLIRPASACAMLALFVLLGMRSLVAAPFMLGSLTEGQHTGEFIISEVIGGGQPSRENITVLSGQNLTAGAVIGRVTKGIGRVSIPTVVTASSSNGTVSNVYAGPEVQVGNYVLTCTAAVANGGVWSVACPDGNLLPALTMTPGAGGTTKYRSRHINFTITDGSTDFHTTDTFTFVVDTTAPTVIGGTGTGTISALAMGPDAKPGNYRVYCITATTNGGTFQVFRGGPDGGESLGSFLMAAGSGAATAFETREISFTLTDATDFIVADYFDVCVFNNLAGGKVVAWDPTTYDGRQKAVGVLYDTVDATSADTAGVIVTRNAAVLKASLQWAAAITASQKVSAYADLDARGIVAR